MRTRGRIVALEGPSGAGKTTSARAVARRFGWILLEEAYDRLDPPPPLRYRNDRELLKTELALLEEDARRYRDARTERAEGRIVIADTGFLGTVSYTAGLFAAGLCERTTYDAVVRSALARARRGELGVPDLTLYLSVRAAVRRARAKRDPVRHPPEYRDRHERVGRFELADFRPWLARRVPSHVGLVRGADPPSEVARRIAERTRATRPVPEPEQLLARGLRSPLRPPASGGNR